MAAKNEMTTATDAKNEIVRWGKSLRDYAMRDYNQNKFLKSAIIAVTENQNLMECMSSPDGRSSLYHAICKAATTGLSLNPQEGKACLIAYNKKASYQIMKNGMLDMIMATGEVKSVIVDIVRENDYFELSKSADGDTYTFRPARKNRGDMDGVFCSIVLKSGEVIVKYMTVEEINNVRDNYSSMYRNRKEASPWHHSYVGMAKKTVIKTAIRDVNISTDLNAMIDADDDFSMSGEKELNPPPEQSPQPQPEKPGTTAGEAAQGIESGKEPVTPSQKTREKNNVQL